MPIKFNPNYNITPKIAQALMQIESATQAIVDLPITVSVLHALRQTARLVSTHYSTKIEGNRLTQQDVQKIIRHKGHFPGRERDVNEIKGYYTAFDFIEQCATKKTIDEKTIKTLHALVVRNGKKRIKPTSYRDGQNIIKDGLTGGIVYLPPEAKDVRPLFKTLIQWINKNKMIPYPIIAGIAHYQFVTIHPYYDGNGRVARLLATLILHIYGYDLKGIYCLEEYYARDLGAYYDALSIGPSHNYYEGREQADITSWIEYFCTGVAQAFEKVKLQAENMAIKGYKDQSIFLRKLDPRQRRTLELFKDFKVVTSKQIGDLFGIKPRTSSQLCNDWVEKGFLIIVNFSRKGRKYKLANKYEKLIE